MMDNRKFYNDVLSQNFSVGTFYNPTRLIMIYGFLQNGNLKTIYNKSEIARYIFNAYCNNKNLAIHHPNVEIRNLPYFGINCVYQDIEQSLEDWIHDAKNNTLSYDAKNIYLDIDNDISSDYLKKMLDVLFKKIFNQTYCEIPNIDNNILIKDKDLNVFGKSVYRDYVFADMQYCALCDECNKDNLFVVHILGSTFCNHIEDLSNINNGLLMCKEHANMYNNGEFVFNDRGYVISENPSLKNTRLSNTLYLKKKQYIVKMNEFYEKK